MTCEICKTNSPRYLLTKLCCCARLVRASRPLKVKQETMLEVIRKTPGAPLRDAIINSLKEPA